MNETFAEGAFNRKPPKRNGNHRLGKSKAEQRQRLHLDTRQWLNSGHHIEQLPPGPVTASGRFDTFSNLMIESGLAYEF